MPSARLKYVPASAHCLAALFPGGHAGHRHQRLLLEQGEAALSLQLHPEGRAQQLRKLGYPARAGQRGTARALGLHPQQAPPVPKYGSAHLQPKLRDALAQPAVAQGVGGQFPAQFRRGGSQQIGQLQVLPANCGPALPHPGVILPAVK